MLELDGMHTALEQAQKAAQNGEVPIGASLKLDGVTRFVAANTCQAENHPLQHAELKLLQQAAQKLSQAEFRRATLYVTLEPCPMCLGAMLHCHLGHLVFGAYNLKWGVCGTVVDLSTDFPSQPLEIYGGICEAACTQLLNDFFAQLR